MRIHRICTLAAVTAWLAAGPAQAQVFPRPTGPRLPSESGKNEGFRIKRKTVSGTVKSVDVEKKKMVVETGKGSKSAEMIVDVGPSVIKAGKGGATLGDARAGDKVTVYGEITIQGGIRAMEITLPKERMSIAPPEKPKKVSKKDAKAEEPKPEDPKDKK